MGGGGGEGEGEGARGGGGCFGQAILLQSPGSPGEQERIRRSITRRRRRRKARERRRRVRGGGRTSCTSPYSHNRACRLSNSDADRLTWKLRPAVSVTEKVKSGAGQPGPCFVNPAAATTNGQQSQPTDLELPQFSHTEEPMPASHSNIGRPFLVGPPHVGFCMGRRVDESMPIFSCCEPLSKNAVCLKARVPASAS
jgi:hypothetical protein